MPEKWEDELLLEADTLVRLDLLFTVFTEELEEILLEHQDDIGHNLAMLLAVILHESHLVHTDTVSLDTMKIPGIRRDLADVMDELHVFQAGLPCKKGAPYED